MENPTVMCGGPADESFACLSTVNVTNDTMTELWSVSLGTGLVFGNPLMSTGGNRVYWVDSAGIVKAADPLTGTGGWTQATGVSVPSESYPEFRRCTSFCCRYGW